MPWTLLLMYDDSFFSSSKPLDIHVAVLLTTCPQQSFALCLKQRQGTALYIMNFEKLLV